MINYHGRFAPSPSGPLHFGSLVAALGSWLDARQHKGEWTIRIEDIDPPREIKGAADDILNTLDKFGLHWDGQVTYQSDNLQEYQQIIEQLYLDGSAYRCTCSRKQIKESGGIYQNYCRDKNHSKRSSHSVRLKVNHLSNYFDDLFQGRCKIDKALLKEDFILKRKDGLYAYMLAVVLDDHQEGITHIIRGADLLETTIQQLYLFEQLKVKAPIYGHLPLVVNQQGLKLSKQNHALAVTTDNISECLWQALSFLQQNPPASFRSEARDPLLDWAIINWRPEAFAGQLEYIYPVT